ncbi:unnamed protein product, partial [marine sediment metagenome]
DGFLWMQLRITINNSPSPIGGTHWGTVQLNKTIDIVDCPDGGALVMFRDRMFNWSFMPFPMKQYRVTATQNKAFRNINEGREKYNVDSYDSLRLNTGFIDEKYNDMFEDLLASPVVYVVDSVGGLVRHIVRDTTIAYRTRRNNRLIQYEMAFSQSIKNFSA